LNALFKMNYFTWEVVTVDLDPERVKYKCNIVKGGNCCDKSIKGIARSNQLLTHLQNNHPSEHAAFKQSEKYVQSQAEIRSISPRREFTNDPTSLAAFCFALNSLPHRLISKRAFRKIYKGPNISRNQVREAQSKLAAVVDKEKKNILAPEGLARRPVVTASADGSTLYGSKMVNMMLNCEIGGNSTELYETSFELGTKKCSAKRLGKLIINRLQKLIDTGVRVVGLAMDNENLSVKVGKLVKKEFPFIEILPDVPHILQLAVRDFFEDDRVKPMYEKYIELNYRIRKEKEV